MRGGRQGGSWLSGRKLGFLLFVISTIAVGLNIRGPIVAVPPLIPQIAEDLGLQNSALALLTAIPLVCFAVLSPLVGVVAARIGTERSIVLSLCLLAVAVGLRPWFAFPGLVIGSVAVGVAIATCNVLVPAIVRRNAGARAALVMSMSTASYGLGAGLSAWAATPISDVVGWRGAMASLALPTAVAILVFLVSVWVRRAAESPAAVKLESAGRPSEVSVGSAAGQHGARVAFAGYNPWRDPGALVIGVFFGLQSVLFFGSGTWLPTILIHSGSATQADGGLALSLFQGVGMVGMLSISPLRIWLGSYRAIGMLSVVGWLAMFIGILVAPELWVVWAVIGGFAQGAGVSLALVLLAVRPVHQDLVTEVSVTVQSLGYGLAVLGPIVLAAVADATDTWDSALWVCIGVTVIMGGVSWVAASPRPIGIAP